MIEIRRTTSLNELMQWRAEVIKNVFDIDPDAELLNSNMRYYEDNIHGGYHMAFIASIDGEDCGCGAVCFTSELPSPDNPTGRCAYLMNIYVRKGYRNIGVAHHIVQKLIDEAMKQRCDKIYLETTIDGRPLYESLGFRDMKDMMKYCGRNNR